MFESSLFIPLLTVLLLTLVFNYLVFPLWISTLSKVPAAHPLCHVTDAWILWKRWIADENEPILEAHRKKGRLIRLSPTEVSINQIEGGVKIVGGKFDRSDWWMYLFTRENELPLSALPSKVEHGVRKKILANLYPNSQLCASTSFRKCLQTMRKDILGCISSSVQASEPLNVLLLSIAASIDVLVSHNYGLQNRPRFLMDFDKTEDFFTQMEIEEQAKFCQAELPTLYYLLRRLGIRPWNTEANNAMNYINQFGKNLTDRVIEDDAKTEHLSFADEDQDSERSSPNLYNSVKQSFGERNLEGRLCAEMLDQVNAGTTSVSISLTYCIIKLSEHHNIQSALRDEFLGLEAKLGSPSVDGIFPSDFLKELDRLPLLEACITETIRVYPPITRQLPRRAPPEGFSFEGYYVPRDTTVSISSYNLHREESVFEGPLRWDPYRWLGNDPEKLQTMRSWLWGFGSGPFGCPGLHIGRHIMNIFLFSVYQNYVSELEGEEDWKPYLNGVAFPASKKVPIRFTPVN